MTHTGGSEKREASKKRLGSLESNVKSERAKKKARPTETAFKLSRKRAWNEVTETEYLNGEQDSSKRSSISQGLSRKALRVGSLGKYDGEGDKLAANCGSRGLEPSTQSSVGTLRENGDAQGPALPQKKWKRTPIVANFGGVDSTLAPSGSSLRGASGALQDANGEDRGMEEEKQGKQKQSRENKVIRKSLQTVRLGESRMAGEKKTIAEHEEASIGFERESAGTVSISEQTALNGRDRKRSEADMGDDSPSRPSEKKRRIHASHRSEEQGTWKRRMRHNKGNSAAASDDMGVSISEAWKRLRDWKDTETSGSSVNGRSDSDLSMQSCPSIPECIGERSKKARYDSPSPPVERKWKRYQREKKQSSSSKRQRDGNGCESSGSSGSEMAQSSYLHNRKWKRPRYENLMIAQGRSLRRLSRDG